MLSIGALALAPPLVVHGFRNGSDTELRYLNFHAPGGGFADYLRWVAAERPTSNRLTWLYPLADGRFLQIQA